MRDREKVAIIGVALRFPGGSDDLASFWEAVTSGESSITRFADHPAHTDYVPVHGTLDHIETFDAELFGYSPREARLIDPQQRKFLECAWESLERSGYLNESAGQRYGVVAGVGSNAYFLKNVLPYPAHLAELGETSILVSSEKDHVATRVAHRLGLTGPAYTVQTSCSTSLVAVHLACRALQTGDADLMVAGGSSIQVPQDMGHVFTPDGISSRDGQCRPFDAGATGTVSGSGVGVVVLKRYEEARADGDHILGVIAGSAINNDGSNKVGYTAPSVPGQVAVIRRALEEAGVDPSQVGYVETHGTGTQLGDAIEFEALRTALGTGEATCVLGTLKSQTGHLDSAAGIAGLIKAMMVVATGTVPANVGFERPHPDLGMEDTRFELRSTIGAWPSGHSARWAGVSSFGLGGTNAHVVLEQPGETEQHVDHAHRGPTVLPISAQTAGATQAILETLPRYLSAEGAADALSGPARTLQHHRRELPFRAALVGSNAADVVRRASLADPQRTLRNPRLGFMFTGFGAQWPGMCAGLSERHPVFALAMTEALGALGACGVDLPSDLTEATAAEWRDARTGQPMLFAAQYAFGTLLRDVAGPPDFTLGHSLGEYAAALFAGGLDLWGAARLVSARAEILSASAGGGMTSVMATEEHVRDLLGDDLVIAARNAPRSIVASGAVEHLRAFEQRALEAGIKTTRLDIDMAAHSPHLDDRLPLFMERANSVVMRPFERQFISTLDGRAMEQGDSLDADHWANQLRHAVEFNLAVSRVGQRRSVVLVEIGAGQSLSTFVRQTQTSLPLATVPSLPSAKDSLDPPTAWAEVVAQLWTAGIAVDWERAGGPGPRSPRTPMPTYPFEATWHWIDPPSEGAASVDQVLESPASSSPERMMHEARPDLDGDVASIVGRRWSELLGTDTPDENTNFFEVGGDSLLLVRLIGQLREAFGVAIPLREAASRATVLGITNLIVKLRSSQ